MLHLIFLKKFLAGEPGFEPRLTESECFMGPCVGFHAELSRFFHREVSHL